MTAIRRRGFITLLGVATLVLVLGACGAAEEPTARPQATAVPQATATAVPTQPTGPQKGGILVVREANTPGRMEPILAKGADVTAGMNVVYAFLVFMGPDFSLQPQLAESWELSDGNTVLTMKLRDGVKFHDGSDVNAQAVKAALDNIIDPERASLSSGLLATLESVDVVDNLTVRLNMKSADAVLLSNMAERPGMIPSLEAMQATTLDEFNRNPVGASCFKFVELIADSQLKAERWDQCFSNELPYLDGVTIRYINDEAVSLANLRSGDVDLIAGIRADQVALLKDEPGLTINLGWDTHYRYFAVNRNMEPTDDVMVRRAISMAMDRQKLITGVYAGLAVPIYGPIIPAFSWAWDPSYKKYAYDKDAAIKMLADAGYPNGFTLGPVVWYGEQSGLPLLNAYADMLSEVGITLDLQLLKSSEASKGYQVDWKYAAYSSKLDAKADMDFLMRDHFFSTGRRNVGQNNTPGLDDLIDKGRAAFDLAERAKFYKQAQDIIVENHLEIFVMSEQIPDVFYDYVKDVSLGAAGSGANYHSIWLDK